MGRSEKHSRELTTRIVADIRNRVCEARGKERARESSARRVAVVSEFPVVQHRHEDGRIVSVRLRRIAGEYRALCAGCGTEFLYRKPQPSRVTHHKSPILPEVKGNYEDPESDHH
jgi:hypothetical protein